MFRHIHRTPKNASPMLGAGLIALILFITFAALLSMHPDAKDQFRSSVAAGSALNNQIGLCYVWCG